MKFTQPVSMPCTKEQYEAFLRDPLYILGYEEANTSLWHVSENMFIATNYDNISRWVGNIKVGFHNRLGRYYIETFNPDLFLAIAAMTDDPFGIPGEYWTFQGGEYLGPYTSGKVYKSIYKASEGRFTINNGGGLDGYGNDNRKAFRKSTLEELIKQLSNQENSKQEMETVKVTREDLSKVWKVACDAWKLKIEGYATKYGSPLSSELEIPNSIVAEMFREANTRQEVILKEVFPNFKEDENAWKQLNVFELKEAMKACRTLSETTGLSNNLQILHRSTAEDMDKPELGGRALWVYGSIDVVLHQHGKSTIIEFRRR